MLPVPRGSASRLRGPRPVDFKRGTAGTTVTGEALVCHTLRHVGHVSSGSYGAYEWHDYERSYEHKGIHSLFLSIIAAGNHKDISL